MAVKTERERERERERENGARRRIQNTQSVLYELKLTSEIDNVDILESYSVSSL